MKNTIYAKSRAESILDKLNKENRVHSIFKNGINIEGSSGLVFIGTDINGKLPFGIHLNQPNIELLVNIDRDTMFEFNKELETLVTTNYVIELNKAEIYSSKLPRDKKDISHIGLSSLLNYIREMNIFTGLDMTIEDMLLDNEGLIYRLKTSVISRDEEYINGVLKSIIGRGKGLTPSGDDLLIGLLWINEISGILSKEFLNRLKQLIFQGGLTTDVSINYYKSAFKGDYSSSLIDLCYSIIEFNEEEIRINLENIIQYGHTSGADLLSGIALGLIL
jgi:hypothetical protein